MSRDCRKPKRQQANNNNQSNNVCDALTVVACNTGIAEKSKEWCVDSGATRHMCNERRKFVTINANTKSKVFTAANHFVNASGAGDVNLKTEVNKNETNSVKLQNALYVPELRNNLLSVSRATDCNYSVTFKKHYATVNRKDGSIVLSSMKRDGLYIVNEKSDCAMATREATDNGLLKWHQRYGHVNVNDLKKMKNDEIVRGMDFSSKVNNLNCEICAKCKIHVLPFKQSDSREEEKLGLVHSDICGPMKIESLGGGKYFVTFIDDCTRFTEIVILNKRSDVLQAFKNYKCKMELQTGQKIKKLRTDNGREYLSNEFKTFLQKEGIIHQLTVEYTPQQNGVAERANRTLVEMARCLMLQGQLPGSLWAEAMNAATYLRNRCATKCLEQTTPYEAWAGQKPWVGFLRTIGSRVIALNKGHKGGKFSPKGEEYVLVGYSETSKAYRLWKPGSKTVIKARDVKFIEEYGSPTMINSSSLPFTTSNEEYVIPDVLENPKEESHCEKEETEDEGEVYSESEEEVEKKIELQRGPGRPKLVKTGKPGRRRKMYNMVQKKFTDPETSSEIFDREDKDL